MELVDRIKELREVTLEELIVIQGGLKTLSDEAYTKFKTLLLDVGIASPFHLWDDQGRLKILDGTQRLSTYKRMRDEGISIPEKFKALIIDAENEKQARKTLAGLASVYGKISKEGAADFLRLSEIDFDWLSSTIALPDFKLQHVKEFFRDEAKDAVEDAIPEVKESICKLGDIWILGNHWLMCGDSTKIEDVEKLMDGEKADMVFTDPPYDQSTSVGGLGDKRPDWAKHRDNGLSDFEPSGFLKILSALKIASIYIFCNKNLLKRYFQWIEDESRSWNLLVMRKKNPIPMKNNTFLADVEWLVFTRGDGATFNNNLEYDFYRRVFDTEVKASEFGHPTEKRVSICERFIQISSNEKDKVLDLFGGSGSTLIACEKTKRKCFMMEIDPHYCDIIINRFEAYSGNKALLA